MAANKKNSHLSLRDRIIIQTGVENGSTKTAIAKNLNKDKTTIAKEISNHRTLVCKCKYSIECAFVKGCPNRDTIHCSVNCAGYKPFVCKYRDRSPGACNGCTKYKSCPYNKFKYDANTANEEYRELLVGSRQGVNATVNEVRDLGNKIKPMMDQGQSLHVICQNHPEIEVSERTLYNYIEDGVFQDAGVSITCLDLKKQVNRKIPKKKAKEYAKRKDRSYLKGRTHKEYQEYMDENPYAHVVEMDTVYNDISNGPFIQTFKFRKYDLLICILHRTKTAQDMLNGILYLEQILGEEIFEREVEVLLTDRGNEFVLANETETRENGTRRTRMYYCDSMASWQKGSLENIHLLLREICPKGVDLYALGLTSQEKVFLICSHINSYVKKKLDDKTSFQLVEFYNHNMAEALYAAGMDQIPADQVTLKPYLLKEDR